MRIIMEMTDVGFSQSASSSLNSYKLVLDLPSASEDSRLCLASDGDVIPALERPAASPSLPGRCGPRPVSRTTNPSQSRRFRNTAMFDRDSLEALLEELRDEWELEPDWEEIQRAAHLGVARADAGVELGDLDSRVVALIDKHNPG